MRRLLKRERKIIALGVLVVLLALVYAAVAAPVVAGFAHRSQERRQLLSTYARNQRILGGMHVVGSDARAQRASDHRYVITAPSVPLGADFLKERVSRTVVQQGGSLRSLQDMQADALPGQLRVRCDAQLTTGQLYEVLRRLQTEEPYAVVEYLSVAVSNDASSGRVDPMAVRIEVSTRFRPAQGGAVVKSCRPSPAERC